MAETYTKLASTITDSSIWAESLAVRVVWITMMAMADEDGIVRASVSGLSRRANVPIDDVRDALARFVAPDPDSRSSEHEGRRVERIEGGWRLLNHARYRDWGSRDSRRDYERERKRKQRARLSRNVPDSPGTSRTVPQCPDLSAQAEADSEAEAETTPPTPLAGGTSTTVTIAPAPQNTADQWALELDIHRRAEGERLGVALYTWSRKQGPPDFGAAFALIREHEGLQGRSALERVQAVVTHAAELVAEHKRSGGSRGLHPGAFSGMFFGGGFQARYDALRESEQKASGARRRKTEQPPPDIDGTPLTDDERALWLREGGYPGGMWAVQNARAEAVAAASDALAVDWGTA